MGIGRTHSNDTSRQPNNTTMKVAATILVFALCAQYASADDNWSEKASDRYGERWDDVTNHKPGRGGGGGGCFPGSSLVKLSSGESRPMRDVETGDFVMTMVEGRMTTTKVLGFVAKSVSASTEYLNIRTEDGRSLSISQTHVMFVSDPYGNSKDVMAKDVNIGDRVMVQDGDHVKKSVVVEIGLEAMVGAYVPVTEHGTLMVDDVLCSCYTNCDHPTVHLLFSPARWFPSLFLTDTEGGTIYSRLGPHVGYYLHKIGMLNYFHSNTMQRAREETQDVEKTMDAETSVCMAPALVHDVCPSFNFMKL